MANGICSAGSGIGGIIFSFAVRAIMEKYSLAWALRTCGLVSGVMNILAHLRSAAETTSSNLAFTLSISNYSDDIRLFWRLVGDS